MARQRLSPAMRVRWASGQPRRGSTPSTSSSFAGAAIRARARSMARSVARRMPKRSISPALAWPRDQCRAWLRIRGTSSARRRGLSFLLSVRPAAAKGVREEPESTTAAANTGPNRAPRPTSSTPTQSAGSCPAQGSGSAGGRGTAAAAAGFTDVIGLGGCWLRWGSGLVLERNSRGDGGGLGLDGRYPPATGPTPAWGCAMDRHLHRDQLGIGVIKGGHR